MYNASRISKLKIRIQFKFTHDGKIYLSAELLLNVLLKAVSPHRQSRVSYKRKTECQQQRTG